ncbi:MULTISPECIES: hypothetical protein [unclassified Clostridium]|uniref:hypothetical protein n=1 Tax=unclassified Clostridium TaxID=2614128 RepID=UPI003216FEBE
MVSKEMIIINSDVGESYIGNIKVLKNLYKEIWWSMPTCVDIPLEANGYIKKKKNEKKFEKFIDEFIKIIERFPLEEENRELWKKNSNSYLENMILGEELFKLGTIDKKMKDQFFTNTKVFINQCKIFDKEMNYEDIGQAMRNVWIVSLLQKMKDMDISFTMATFGYSMLYPYTDNYLDNLDISIEEKKEFNNRFYKRLCGEEIEGRNSHEKQVFKLVEYIESVFNRNDYPKVFQGLLLIHEGQVKSLIQQEGISNPYERDMLDISIEKGGASVIVDGYLINGSLNKEEEIFTYGYGFLLQLCDDLQDVRIDYENKHMTIMSQLAGKYHLDNIVNKLINLTIHVLDDATCFKGENIEDLKKLIKDNCILMIIFAIVMNKNYFSKEYVKEISKYLPFTISYIENIKGNLRRKFENIKKSYHGISLEDIIYYLIQ